MKIALWGTDLGPQNMLKLLQSELGRLGLVGDFFDSSKHSPSEYKCLLLVPSAAEKDRRGDSSVLELFSDAQIPILVIEDVPYAAFRVPQGKAAGLCVLPAMEGYASELLLYGYAEALGFTPPLHWRDGYKEIVASRGNPLSEEFGLPVVLFAGGKNAAVNNLVLDALATLAWIKGFKVVVTSHPRQELSEEEGVKQQEILGRPEFLPTPEGGNRAIMPRVDATVFVSNSTDTIVGAFARLPMVLFANEEVREDLKRLGCPGGWWVVESGMAVARSTEELERALSSVLSGEGQLSYIQKRVFPIPDWGKIPEKVLETIEYVVNR